VVRLKPEDWSPQMAAALGRVRPRLVKILRAYRVPALDSEDLVQDALLVLVTKWAEIRDPETWLIGTVRFLCRNYVRQQLRSKTVVADPEQLEQLAGAAPGGGQEECDVRVDLERLARALGPRQRRLLRLVVGLGLDGRELARVLGGATPASLRRARRRVVLELRALLEAARHRR
jgi:RNA polymerase sigma factor (sigma-70 family)